MSNKPLSSLISSPALSIDESIVQVTHIINWAKEHNSRLGYFAALYRKVLTATKKSVENNTFDNKIRMERLAVVFANRYINACYQHQTGQTPTQSWLVAFNGAQAWRLIVLQHLLLGMNAHINLDLGIAVADTTPAEELPDMKPDFDKINLLLASMVEEVLQELAEIWPLQRIFSQYLGDIDNDIINFSMRKAREAAWSFAESLAPLSESDELRQQRILTKDQAVASFSAVITHPGFVKSSVGILIRLGERGSIRQIIEILE